MIRHKKLNIKIDGNRQYFNGLLDESEIFIRCDQEDDETLEQQMLREKSDDWEVVESR